MVPSRIAKNKNSAAAPAYKNKNVGRSTIGLSGPNSDGEYALVLFSDFGGCIEASLPRRELADALDSIGQRCHRAEHRL